MYSLGITPPPLQPWRKTLCVHLWTIFGTQRKLKGKDWNLSLWLICLLLGTQSLVFLHHCCWVWLANLRSQQQNYYELFSRKWHCVVCTCLLTYGESHPRKEQLAVILVNICKLQVSQKRENDNLYKIYVWPIKAFFFTKIMEILILCCNF